MDILRKKPEKKRILLAEDDPGIVMITKFRLEHAGYEVLTATNGEDVLSCLHTNDKCLELGVEDWIEKPFKSEKLLETVRRLLEFRSREGD